MSAQPTKPKPSDIAQRMRRATLHDKPSADAAITDTPATDVAETGTRKLLPPESATTAGAATAPTRGRRVRYTLDLSPEQHRALKRFAFDAEADASAIVRALLAELGSDPALARRVLDQIRHDD
jgi:hypothetical protein